MSSVMICVVSRSMPITSESTTTSQGGRGSSSSESLRFSSGMKTGSSQNHAASALKTMFVWGSQ